MAAAYAMSLIKQSVKHEAQALSCLLMTLASAFEMTLTVTSVQIIQVFVLLVGLGSSQMGVMDEKGSVMTQTVIPVQLVLLSATIVTQALS